MYVRAPPGGGGQLWTAFKAAQSKTTTIRPLFLQNGKQRRFYEPDPILSSP